MTQQADAEQPLATYSLSAAAEDLGVQRITLRRWIADDPEVIPVGVGSGRRYELSHAQVEAVRARRIGRPGSERRRAAAQARTAAIAARDRRLAAAGYLTATYAAQRLDRTPSAIYTLVERGELRSLRVRDRIYFRAAELDRWRDARRDRLYAQSAAAEFGLSYDGLRDAIGARVVPAEWTDGGYVVDRAVLKAVLRRQDRCHAAGCGRVLLPPGGCGVKGHLRSDAWLEQTQESRDRTAADIRSRILAMGLVDVSTAAAAILYSPGGIRGAAQRQRDGVLARRRPPVKHVEVATVAGATVRRIVSDPLELGRWYVDRFGTKDAHRRLAPSRSRAKGTVMGRPLSLTEDELAMVLELRAHDPRMWGYRKLAGKVNARRAPGMRKVSHMAVKRALQASASA